MKNLLIVVASSLILLTGCNKADEFTKFDMDYSTAVTVPATSVINTPYDFYSPEIDSDYKAKFEKYQTVSDKVESIKAKSLKVNINSPSGSSLNFIKSLEIYIEGDGFGPVRYAWKMDIPETVGESMSINIADTDLKALIMNDKFKVKATATLDKAITVDHEINMDFTFEVDAKLL